MFRHRMERRYALTRMRASLPTHLRQAIDSLQPSDVCIDCGAHVGLASRLLGRRGATVYAIEPNPAAYAQLVSNTAKMPNVVPIWAAASTAGGESVDYYLHEDHNDDEVTFASGGSLIGSMPNVSGSSISVPSIDLSDLIRRLGRVAFLKVDIEGYETQLIPQLVASNTLGLVDLTAVETHERKWSDITTDTESMKAAVKDAGLGDRVSWDWP